MALTTSSFAPASSMANSDCPRIFGYGTGDLAAVVEGANYFDVQEIYGVTQTGDVLLAQMLDATKFYNLTVDRDAGTVVLSVGLAIT